jgi:hypothetical protein
MYFSEEILGTVRKVLEAAKRVIMTGGQLLLSEFSASEDIISYYDQNTSIEANATINSTGHLTTLMTLE